MAQTAVVNPRRRRDRFGRFLKSVRRRLTSGRRRRRRNPDGLSENPRRRRRRYSRRRRNPGTEIQRVYSSGGYRAKNPDGFNVQEAFQILPAGVLGDFMGRWAVKQAGPFEPAPGAPGVLQPGFSHAIACYLGAEFGSQMIGSVLGDQSKAMIAKIACLSYGGSLFMRLRFMRDSTFIKENLSLQGESGTVGALGQDTFVDAAGNTWKKTASGWQLAGFESESAIGEGEETEVIELPADVTAEELQLYGIAPDPAALHGGELGDLGYRRRRGLSGFESSTPIGGLSSFGY